jgi:hypothetical protein
MAQASTCMLLLKCEKNVAVELCGERWKRRLLQSQHVGMANKVGAWTSIKN